MSGSESACCVDRSEAAKYDLLVVGGGSAGFAAAIRGAELGARVALVEGGTLGGTCVNVGCVPSKTLIRAAEAQHRRARHAFRGIPAENGRPDWRLVREQKDELVVQLRETKYRDVLRAYDSIELVPERAMITSGGSVRLAGGRELRAGKILVATGASPWMAPIPGLAQVDALDSTSAMALQSLPSSMIVLGGSAVGLELAQTFARLGVRVTVLEAMPRLLPAEDPVVGEALAGYLREEGLIIHAGVSVESVERGPRYAVRFRANDELVSVEAEQLLVATGRRPNTRDLGLEAIGVRLGAKGEILVNDHLRTSRPEVYAAGDVIGDPMFVYLAAYAGATAAENALNGDVRPYDPSPLPRVTFTDPAVASVGWTAEEARAKSLRPLVSRLLLTHVPRALAARETRGFIQLVADSESRRLLGAQILASEAGELIVEPTLAIRFSLTIDDLISTFHPYLTLSEGIKLAAQGFTKDVSKLSCCAA